MTASSERSRDPTIITGVARLLVMIGFAGLFVPLAGQGTPYCAFEVNVRAPDGRPIAKAPVALIRYDKMTFSESTTDAQGIARICDAPLELEWSPKMRRPVKTQNPFKGELSHGFVAQVVH